MSWQSGSSETSTSSSPDHCFTYSRLRTILSEKKSVDKPPQPSTQSLKEIQRILQLTVDAAECKAIQDAVAGSYDEERDFDIALFAALKKDLEALGVKVTPKCDNAGIVQWLIIDSEHLKCDGYAFGFARKAKRQAVCADEDALSENSNETEEETLYIPAHSCCIFEQDKTKEWQVTGVLTVVSVKLSETSGKGEDETMLNKEPFIQAISSVFENSWPDICRYGLVDHELKALPIAMIAAQKETAGDNRRIKKPKLAKSRRFRWRKGSLLIPEWGGMFQVQHNGSKRFSLDKEKVVNNDEVNLQHKNDTATTVDLYMETILFGIQLCVKYCDILALNEGNRPFPSPLSGLPPPAVIPEYNYCGSPLLSKTEVDYFNKLEELKPETERKPKYAISQGDLFYFKTLNFKDLPGQRLIWLGDSGEGIDVDSDEESVVESDEASDVFVKVWSQSTHEKIQFIAEYEKAIIILESEQAMLQQFGQKSALLGSLSNVYIGSNTIDSNIGTKSAWTVIRKIHGHAVKPYRAKELYELYGDAVKPSQQSKVWLWTLFKTLCREILLPLADRKIVHQDLRLGFDCTYNIMIGKTSTDQKCKMRIIDYESLCRDYSTTNDRYPIAKLTGRSIKFAHDVLFQQCVGVAYAWIRNISAKDMNFSEALAWFGETLNSEFEVGEGEVDASKQKTAITWWISRDLVSKRDEQMIDRIKTAKVFEELFGRIDKIFHEDSEKEQLCFRGK